MLGHIADEIARHLRNTQELLCGHEHLKETAVHEARKSLKKVRAGLKLLQDAGVRHLGDAGPLCRDIGRLLSDLRDTDVCLHTLTRLYEDDIEVPAALVTKLRARRAELHGAESLKSSAQKAIRKDLKGLEQIMQRIPRQPVDDDAILAAFDKTHRRGRRRYRSLRRDPTAETFHDLRKIAKRELHQGRFLSGVLACADRIEALDRLGEHLGLAQDLVVLGQVAAALDELDVGLVEHINRRKDSDRRQALDLAEEIYGGQA